MPNSAVAEIPTTKVLLKSKAIADIFLLLQLCQSGCVRPPENEFP